LINKVKKEEEKAMFLKMFGDRKINLKIIYHVLICDLIFLYSQNCVQQPLLGDTKKWSLFSGGCYSEVPKKYDYPFKTIGHDKL